MRYADTLLTDGEVIVHRARQHWLALILEARLAVVLWVIGILLLLAVVLFNLQAQNSQIVGMVALICLGIGLLIFLYRAWQWWAQDYIITNRRLMKVTGILNKRSSGSSLEKINDAILDQNVLGRILDYGDLDILTAAGESAVDYFRMLKGAKQFKRVMQNQKHALEMGYVYGQTPTPPIRATGTGGANMIGEPAAPPREAEAPPREAQAPPRETAPPLAAPAPPPAASPWPAEPARVPMSGDPGQGQEPASAAPEAPFGAAGPTDAMPDTQQGPPAGAELDRQPPTSAGPGEPDESLEITQTLARLADLRDRGAISEADYEAKKQDLLGRL